MYTKIEGTENAAASGIESHINAVCETSRSWVTIREIGFPADRYDDDSRQHNRPGEWIEWRSTFRMRRFLAPACLRLGQMRLPFCGNWIWIHLGTDDADGDERTGGLLHDLFVQRRCEPERIQAAICKSGRSPSCKPAFWKFGFWVSSFDLTTFISKYSSILFFIFSIFKFYDNTNV